MIKYEKQVNKLEFYHYYAKLLMINQKEVHMRPREIQILSYLLYYDVESDFPTEKRKLIMSKLGMKNQQFSIAMKSFEDKGLLKRTGFQSVEFNSALSSLKRYVEAGNYNSIPITFNFKVNDTNVN